MSNEQLWRRLQDFLDAVVPVAEAAGARTQLTGVVGALAIASLPVDARDDRPASTSSIEHPTPQNATAALITVQPEE